MRRQPGGLDHQPQGELPASGPTSPRSGWALSLPPRACNPTPYLAAAAHPRPRWCTPGTRSEPRAASKADGAGPDGGLRRFGTDSDLSLLLLPGRVQEQVSIPVLFGLHVVVGLLGIIMVHDGARVLGAVFLPPPSLLAAAAAAAAPA